MSLRQRKSQQDENFVNAADDDDDDNGVNSTRQQQQQQQQKLPKRRNCKIIFCIAIPFFIFGAIFGQNYSIQHILNLVEQLKDILNAKSYESYGNKLAKVWKPIQATNDNGVPTWCVPQPAVKHIVNGLIFVKLHRAASSTGAGVTLQIANNVAKRNNQETPCATHHKHGDAFLYRSQPNFVWTMIREPSKRSISDFFFSGVGRNGTQFSPHTMIKFLDNQRMEQINYLSSGHRQPLDPVTGQRIPMNYTDVASIATMIQDKIMNTYNFIGLAERMDESLVVLKMLMNLKDKDVIVLSSKQSGGYDDGKYHDKCHLIPKPYTTPEVDDYIQNGYKTFNPDYMLYHIANVSLDMTIDALGREKVQETVRRHVKLQEIATKYCSTKAIYPCSSTGELQPESEKSCLWNDAGCGYKCVGEVLKKYKNGEIEG